jgi:threonine synthase
MKFVSVHRASPSVGFREALFQGIAPDGGLYVPESLPRVFELDDDRLRSASLHEVGEMVVSQFIDDSPSPKLRGIIERALTFPIPLVKIEEHLYLLELFHGPTLAFKDVGARFMAEAMSYYLAQEQRQVAILVATSGDTGGAVAHGFFGVPHTTVCVLYPSGKVSKLQEQQMTTLGGNIHALEVEGTFDDCQRLVKAALADEGLVRSRALTTANSINVGRLIPQIVYYVWGTAQLRATGITAQPLVVVPSGNFGNLTAAVYAKHLGAPVERFLAATNTNDVVPQYFETGAFTPRTSVQTLSNAMDVGNPSNFARLLHLYNDDLRAMRGELDALRITDHETIAEIRRTHERTGTILDPHTAVGVAAARRIGGSTPTLIAATAHHGKFPEVTLRALGKTVPPPPALESALSKPKRSVRLPADPGSLREFLLRL